MSATIIKINANIMYTLGEIVRTVWGERVPPLHIIDQILVTPLTGLGLAVRTQKFKDADQSALGDLFYKLPIGLRAKAKASREADESELSLLFATLNGAKVKIEDANQFWFGYYHVYKKQD